MRATARPGESLPTPLALAPRLTRHQLECPLVCACLNRIERTEILLEPFDDIVPRDLPKAPEEAPKKKKKKEKKNLSLLSFGEEAAEEDKALQQISAKAVSSHDVLDDPRSAASLLWARPCGLRSLRSPSSIVLQAE